MSASIALQTRLYPQPVSGDKHAGLGRANVIGPARASGTLWERVAESGWGE